jgi:hypothetical protein
MMITVFWDMTPCTLVEILTHVSGKKTYVATCSLMETSGILKLIKTYVTLHGAIFSVTSIFIIKAMIYRYCIDLKLIW